MEDTSNPFLVDKETLHDFTAKTLILIIGLYPFLKNKHRYFYLFLFCSAIILIFEVFMASMALYGIIIVPDRRPVVPLYQILFIWTGTIAARLLNVFTFSQLQAALKLLKEGVFVYRSAFKEENDIKKKWVSLVRFIVSLYKNCILATCVLCILGPIAKYIFLRNSQDSEFLLNPYLPQPFYMPFNTSSLAGYPAAFLMVTVFLITTYAGALCHVTVNLSIALQLCAQIDVLNYSLKNIEQRAYAMMLKEYLKNKRKIEIEDLYQNKEFHRCLYLCLRENAIHHQLILR